MPNIPSWSKKEPELEILYQYYFLFIFDRDIAKKKGLPWKKCRQPRVIQCYAELQNIWKMNALMPRLQKQVSDFFNNSNKPLDDKYIQILQKKNIIIPSANIKLYLPQITDDKLNTDPPPSNLPDDANPLFKLISDFYIPTTKGIFYIRYTPLPDNLDPFRDENQILHQPINPGVQPLGVNLLNPQLPYQPYSISSTPPMAQPPIQTVNQPYSVASQPPQLIPSDQPPKDNFTLSTEPSLTPQPSESPQTPNNSYISHSESPLPPQPSESRTNSNLISSESPIISPPQLSVISSEKAAESPNEQPPECRSQPSREISEGVPYYPSENASDPPSSTSISFLNFLSTGYDRSSEHYNFILSSTLGGTSEKSSISRPKLRSSTDVRIERKPDEKLTKESLYDRLPKPESIDVSLPILKDILGNALGKCYSSLHLSKDIFKQDDEMAIRKDGDLLDFETETEKRFMSIIHLYDHLPDKKVESGDIFCPVVMIPISFTEGSFKSPLLSTNFSSVNLSSDPNEGTPMRMIKLPETMNRNDTEKEVENESFKVPIRLNTSFKFMLYTKMKPLRPFHLNEKLLSFYTFEFVDSDFISYRFPNVLLSTMVSFNLVISTSENDVTKMNEFQFCHPAFVYFSEAKRSHILQLKEMAIEIQFNKVDSMIFDRRDNSNKIFIFGDSKVEEFTIFGLDEYIRNTFKENMHPINWNYKEDQDYSKEREMIQIQKTKTYQFNSDSKLNDLSNLNDDSKNSALAVLDDQIVLGYGDSLFAWKLENENELKIVKVENFERINCLKVISNAPNNSYLSVGSSEYPVIYIYNKEFELLRRLISHTKGITSLCNFGLSLFSASADSNVRDWNVVEGVSMMQIKTQTEEVSAIGIGTFCGQLFVFTAGDNNTLKCWSVECKSLLFKVQIEENYVPKEIIFQSFYNDLKGGDAARLIILSESAQKIDKNTEKVKKDIQFQVFEFN